MPAIGCKVVIDYVAGLFKRSSPRKIVGDILAVAERCVLNMLAAAYYHDGAGLLRPIVRGKTRCRGNGRYRDRESNLVYGCLHGFIGAPINHEDVVSAPP